MIQAVKVIGVTQPVEGAPMELPEDIISYCARVSNPSNQSNFDSSVGLLKYLVKHKHWSPFEMANMTLELKTTRDIARQVLRHRSFAFQEFSQRYADPTEMEFYIRETRMQDPVNRQNSVVTTDPTVIEWFIKTQLEHIEDSVSRYSEAIEKGIAKEQARCFLPEGNTPSVLYMQGSIRSWLHYIDLRCGNGTQAEHIELAKMAAEAITEYFPSLVKVAKGD